MRLVQQMSPPSPYHKHFTSGRGLSSGETYVVYVYVRDLGNITAGNVLLSIQSDKTTYPTNTQHCQRAPLHEWQLATIDFHGQYRSTGRALTDCDG